MEIKIDVVDEIVYGEYTYKFTGEYRVPEMGEYYTTNSTITDLGFRSGGSYPYPYFIYKKVLPRVLRGEKYYYVSIGLETTSVVPTQETGTDYDIRRYELGNYFLDRDSALKYAGKINEVFKERL